MGKKKRDLSDKVRSRQKLVQKKVKVNPFEVKVNKVKHHVLGRKISKHDKGMPGLSRSKAMEKREKTLIQEYNNRQKSNSFVDKRFGEHDTQLSADEKMLKRFAIERMHGEKSNKFSLNDEEDLTHFGQSLSSIEKFAEPDISDDDEEDKGKIDNKLVAQEHFGGFLSQSNYEQIGGQHKSWKEKMEELITKSKKEKYERKKEKEESQQLTDHLDTDFQDIRKLMSALYKKGDETQPQNDDYDMAVRSLVFESKGQATDRLKTVEELAKEEKDKLEKLESDRLRRMRGETTEDKPSHVSADDLHDGYNLDNDDGFVVQYKDGKLIVPEKEDEDENEEGDDEDDEGEEDADSDSNEGDDNEDDEDDEAASEDSYADVQSDEEEELQDKNSKSSSKQKTLVIDPKYKEEMISKAKKELPYTFTIPENYEQLRELFLDHSDEDQITIIDRIRKIYHPSLSEDNKSKLEVFQGTLIEYFCDLALQTPPELKLMDKLVPKLYSLTQLCNVAMGQVVIEQIKDRQAEFQEICDRKAGRGLYPALDTMLLFKLVGVLFPTSDFRHPVTTPTLLFMTQMLAQCPINHERDVAAGLFLCNLCLEWVSLSKRYVPECINFLHGLFFLAADKEPSKIYPVVHPFRPVGEHINILKLHKKSRNDHIPPMKMSEVLSIDMELDALRHDSFRLSAIHQGTVLLQEFSTLYQDLSSYREIFAPVKTMIDILPMTKFPSQLSVKLKSLVEEITRISHEPRKCLVIKSKRPVPLKMFEPEFAEVFEERKSKRKVTDKALNEKQKLQHKYKKELKGAMREIRKDTQAIARKQLNDQMDKDAERKRKVNQIYQSLATQEGDFQANKRKKKSNTDESEDT